MDSIRQPIGELPPEVYWRRRIVTLAFVVLALVVLYYLIKGAVGGDEPGATPGPSVSPTASTSPDVSITGVAACGVGDLLIDLAPTTRNFPDPTLPTFQATVTSTGLADCLLDPQAADAELLITSGSDRIWSNLDCAQAALDGAPVLLSPDETVTLTAEWPRSRSNESCQTGLPEPRSGDYTYHARLTLHGVESTEATFSITD
jgi:hypothetical protein